MKTKIAVVVLMFITSSGSMAGDYGQGDKAPAEKAHPFDKAISLIGFNTNTNDAHVKEFEKSFEELVKLYNLGDELDGNPQSKMFYKKLEEFSTDKNNIFPVDVLMERKFSLVHICPGCKSTVSGQLEAAQVVNSGFSDASSFKIINEISALYLKNYIIKNGKNDESAKKYLRYSIAFSMVNDAFSAYNGANFSSIQLSVGGEKKFLDMRN